MKTNLKHFFSVPDFDHDQEITKTAGLIRIISLSLSTVMFFAFLFGLFFIFQPTDIRIFISLFLSLISFVSFLIMRMGKVRFAGFFLIITWWIIFSFALFKLGGVRVPEFSVYVLITLVTGLLWGMHASFICVGATIILGFIFYFAEMSGLIIFSAEQIPSSGALLINIIIILFSAVLLQLYLNQVKRSTKALQISESKFRNIVQQSIEGIAVTDEQGIIIEWNRSLQQISGYRSEEVLGESIWDVQFKMAPLQRQTPEYKKQLRNMITNFLQTGNIPQAGKQMERELHLHDGSINYIQGTIFPIKTDKGFMLGSITRNVTEKILAEKELKESKRTLETLLSNLPGMAYHCRIDRDWTMEIVSEGCYPLTGYQPEELLFNRVISYGDLIHPADQEYVWEEVNRCLSEDRTFELEYRIFCKDKSEKWVWEKGRGVKDETGNLIWLEGFINDISQKKVAEVTLQKSEEHLKKANTDLQLHVQKIMAIHYAGQRLQMLKDPDELAQNIIDTLDEIVNYDYAALLLIDESSNKLIPYAISDQGKGRIFLKMDKEYIKSHNIELGKGITGLVAKHGESILIGNVLEDKRYYSLRHDILSELCVPLKISEKVIGVINIETSELNAYSEIDQLVLETIASQIAVAIQNASMFKQAKQYSLELEKQIKERKQAQQALSESEERFRMAFLTSPDSININRMEDGLYVNVNRGFTELTGFSGEEVIGKTSGDINIWTDPEDRQKLIEGLKKSGKVNNLEAKFRMKNGKILTGLMSASVIYLNEVPHIISITRSIEEIKQAQEQLKQNLHEITTLRILSQKISENIFLEDLVKSVIEGIGETIHPDLVLFFERKNDRLDLLGSGPKNSVYSHEKTPEHKVGECLCGLAVTNLKAIYSSNIKADPRCTWEECKKAGLTSFASLPLIQSGEVVGVIGLATAEEYDFSKQAPFLETIANEISTGLQNALYLKQIQDHSNELEKEIDLRNKTEKALRESEEKFRSLTEESLVGVYVIQDNIFKYVNPKFAQIFEYPVAEIVDKVSPFQLVYNQDRKLVEKNIRLRLEGAIESKHYDFRGLTKSNKIIYVEVYGTRSVFRGKPVILGTLLDITIRKLAEEKIRESTKQLQLLSAHLQTVREEERKQISREIHDELGQVLTALKMDLSIIGRQFSKQEKDSGLLAEIERMKQIIDFTIQRTRIMITKLRPEILDNLGLIETLKWQISEFEQRYSIPIEFYTDMSSINIPQEEAIAIYRIFQETLTNIIRHAKATKVVVRFEKKPQGLSLSVTDNGVGFDADRQKKSSGFGVIGMKERAISFGGTVAINSKPFQGTEVLLEIKRKKNVSNKKL